MINHLTELCKNHGLKIWQEPHKGRYCIQGQGGVIATCLRATRATHITIDKIEYELAEVTHQIYQLSDIKLAFENLAIK